ncbi:MAG: ISAs1 family transposase [Syntrophobacteraceae bacterium]|jgi:predicted transposase YbfD/YdcC|nr:ISAs1 family transposase [Syntrophobacteraceae bacterium]
MEQCVGKSIQEHFSSVSDPRILLKTRHKLIDVIVITLCAIIAGADDWVEIAAFGREKEKWFKTFLELPNGIPSHDTFGRIFSLINPEEFGKCFVNWIRSAFPIVGTDIIALDGKTARHSHDRANGKPPIHMVSAWTVGNRLVLGQVKTEDKSNEITAIPELLKTLDINGCIVTTDAMGCQKQIARQIVDQGADYLFSLKGNQGNLHKEVELLFQDGKKNDYKDLPHETYTTVEGGHGRVETRKYTVTNDVDWFGEKSKWKKLSTFGMVESTREIGDQTTQETRYFISSLPLNAERFAEAARKHWGVENGLHWCLDISFREDDSRVRSGHAPENLAIIRRFALSLIKQDTHRKIGVKASRKRAGWSNEYLLRLLRLG